ncbi:tachykinin-like peptides receptor 86C, partial [Dinothrombium tinctorium]
RQNQANNIIRNAARKRAFRVKSFDSSHEESEQTEYSETRNGPSNAETNGSNGQRKKKNYENLARVLLGVILCFVFCWLPYNLTSFYIDLFDSLKAINLLPFTLLLGHAHSALNPLVYWLLNVKKKSKTRECVKMRSLLVQKSHSSIRNHEASVEKLLIAALNRVNILNSIETLDYFNDFCGESSNRTIELDETDAGSIMKLKSFSKFTRHRPLGNCSVKIRTADKNGLSIDILRLNSNDVLGELEVKITPHTHWPNTTKLPRKFFHATDDEKNFHCLVTFTVKNEQSAFASWEHIDFQFVFTSFKCM